MIYGRNLLYNVFILIFILKVYGVNEHEQI